MSAYSTRIQIYRGAPTRLYRCERREFWDPRELREMRVLLLLATSLSDMQMSCWGPGGCPCLCLSLSLFSHLLSLFIQALKRGHRIRGENERERERDDSLAPLAFSLPPSLFLLFSSLLFPSCLGSVPSLSPQLSQIDGAAEWWPVDETTSYSTRTFNSSWPAGSSRRPAP